MAAAAAMLVATAAVMVAAGGTGVLGPLGELIGGTAAQEQAPADAGTPRDPEDAIVASPATVTTSAGARRTAAAAPAGPRAGRPDRGTPGSPPVARVPRPAPPRPSAGPVASLPPAPRPPDRPPPADPPRAVDRVDAAVDGVAAQAPEPVKTVLKPVQDVVDGVAKSCREQLPACP